MEAQLIQVLTNTQHRDQAPRQQAELDLKQATDNPAFPAALANIASHSSVDTSIRQAALTSLRQFIEKNWNPDRYVDSPAIPIADDVRSNLKQILLTLATGPEEDRKTKISAR